MDSPSSSGRLQPLNSPLILTDVWKTCNKIRSAIFRYGLNLWDYYNPLDPDRTSLVCESKFIAPFRGPLKDTIGLCDDEITQLAEYFKVPDGRVLYTQFCSVIHNAVPDLGNTVSLVSGREQDDLFHVNCLAPEEERRVMMLLTKMAVLVNSRLLVLRPYFQDYELVSKNDGTVTLCHFARVLEYLGIKVSTAEYNLLVKKFVKDSYTVNYIAFVAAIDDIIRKLSRQGMFDLSGDLLPLFPGKALCADLPKLPRPEVDKEAVEEGPLKPCVLRPVTLNSRDEAEFRDAMQRIRSYVLSEGLRVCQFLDHYDPLRTGRVTEAQFRCALTRLSSSGFNRLYLSPSQVDLLIFIYNDLRDRSRIRYLDFEKDVDQVFAERQIQAPECKVELPPPVMEQRKMEMPSWEPTEDPKMKLCVSTLMKVKQGSIKWNIDLKPFFSSYDKSRSGIVKRMQFRQVLQSVGILLSTEEMGALEYRYLNKLGFDYLWFLQDVAAKSCDEPKFKDTLAEYKKQKAQELPPASNLESDMVQILSKIKKKMVTARVNVLQLLEQHDPHGERSISREDFCRALSVLDMGLTGQEVETLTDVFACRPERDRVDYQRFANTVQEAFPQPCLARAPHLIPLHQLPSGESQDNFLDYDERQTVALAMDKLSALPDMDLMTIFKDFDRCNMGCVSSEQLVKVLAVRNLLWSLSTKEREALQKCFAVECGTHTVIDYRAFTQALQLTRINNRRRLF